MLCRLEKEMEKAWRKRCRESDEDDDSGETETGFSSREENKGGWCGPPVVFLGVSLAELKARPSESFAMNDRWRRRLPIPLSPTPLYYGPSNQLKYLGGK